MDSNNNQISRWVDERLAALDASDWGPNTARALARLREIDRAAALRRIRWMWAASTAAAAFVTALVLFTPRACATPRPCSNNLWQSMFRAHDAIPVPAMPAPAIPEPQPVVKAPPEPSATAPRVSANFKESGSPHAPLTCEIYSDYECPHCALFHRETLPALMEQYVATGLVRLLHRDMPLAMHPLARIAARYANAAGRLGHYTEASDQIFLTQNEWHENGDIDGALAKVLPPDIMEKVRAMVKSDASLDAMIDADIAQARQDDLRQTPSVVIVWKGQRQLMGGGLPFTLLKSYLDERLKP
jgi:protein-disulfide isomerase